MTRHNPLQQLREAKQIARDNSLAVVDVATRDKDGAPVTEHVVYRILSDGRRVRLGKRTDPERLRAYVCKLAQFH